MKKIQPKRAVDVAANEVRLSILNGEFPTGSLLPPERQLAEELEINRLTLRSALARLESEGLIKPKHGKGIVVLDPWRNGALDLWHTSKTMSSLRTLLRRNIAAARLPFSEKGTAKDISKLGGIVKDQNAPRGRFLKEIATAMVEMGEACQSSSLTAERITYAQPEIPLRMLKDQDAACASYMAQCTHS